MKQKHIAIVILLVIVALLLVAEHAKNRRRIMSVTSSPQIISIVPAGTSSPTNATAPAVTVPGTFKDAKPVAVVGAILPLTGVQAVYGQGIKEGLDLAADGVNATEKFGIRVKIIYEDTASEAKSAPAAARKLIATDHAVAIVTGLSPTSLAVAPIAEEKRVVLFTMASLATALNSAGGFVFKNDDVSSKIGQGLAAKARDMKIASTAAIYANYNDSVVESEAAFVKAFAAAGGAVMGEEGFTQDTTDFRTILGKIIAPAGESASGTAAPVSVAIFGLQRDCALAAKQLRDLSYRGQLFGFTCIDDPEVIAVAKTAVEGAIFASFNGTPTPKFIELIKKKYAHDPLRWSAEAFDGMKLLSLALARSYDGEHPITAENLRETLTHLTGYTGEAGHVDFDKEGNATRSLYLKTVRDGKIEMLK